jgi:NAD(P)-dependent dehydrogenase (short-subunit alcohol dehydrogenase family)
MLMLDFLVNNAGLATKSFQTTPSGFEMTIGVKYSQGDLEFKFHADNASHHGHFFFTLNLQPLLKFTAAMKNSDVRIMMVRQ